MAGRDARGILERSCRRFSRDSCVPLRRRWEEKSIMCVSQPMLPYLYCGCSDAIEAASGSRMMNWVAMRMRHYYDSGSSIPWPALTMTSLIHSLIHSLFPFSDLNRKRKIKRMRSSSQVTSMITLVSIQLSYQSNPNSTFGRNNWRAMNGSTYHSPNGRPC